MEESPFLDRQLTAFVQRELEVKEGEKCQVTVGRFAHLHCIADRTFDVGHSSLSDLLVQAVRSGQEAALVEPQHRQYVGAGVDTARRKKRKKSRRDGDSDNADRPPQRERRAREQRSPLPSGEVEMDEDEHAPLQRSHRGTKRRTLLDEDDEDEKDAPTLPPGPPRPSPSDSRVSGQSHAVSGAAQHTGESLSISAAFELPADDSPSRRRRDGRSRPGDQREEETIVVDIDDEVGGSLPAPSLPSEPVDEQVPVPRPPSPLLDLPLEAVSVYADEGWQGAGHDSLDPLMRRLSRFVLTGDGGDSGDVLALPSHVLYVADAAPPISLTPPQPIGASSPITPPSSTRAPPPPAVSPSMSPPASGLVPALGHQALGAVNTFPRPLPTSTVSPVRPPSHGSVAASVSEVGAGSGGPMSAAERKAMAEAKRQRWLEEQREKQRTPPAAVNPPSLASSRSLPLGPFSVSASLALPARRWLG